MENIVEGFCDSRDYKPVSKKLKGSTNLSNGRLEFFIKFLKENRTKRKPAALSFEVRKLTRMSIPLN